MKTCSICKQELDLKEFSPRPKSKVGYYPYCRSCDRDRKRAASEANSSRTEEECNAAWLSRHPRGVAACRRCGEEKPMDGFSLARSHRDGRSHECKDCRKARAQARAGRSEEELKSDWTRVHPSGVARCTRCRENLPAESFYPIVSAPSGRSALCKICSAQVSKESSNKNKNRVWDSVPEILFCTRCSQYKPQEKFSKSVRYRYHKNNICAECNTAAIRLRAYADVDSFWLAHGINPDECAYCPAPATEVEHLTPKSKGGRDHFLNFLPACRSCNASKGNKFDFPELTIDPVWWVGKVAPDDAVEFVKQYHYSKSADKGFARFGLYYGAELRGVTIYNTSARLGGKTVFGPGRAKEVAHHHRLALDPDCPTNTASWFLARAMKQLKQQRPGLRAVLVFADLDQGHEGTIYQALNGIYTGVGAPGHVYWVRQDGVHVGQSSGQMSRMSMPEQKAYAREQGWEMRRSRGKRRYVHLLGGPAERRRLRKELLLTQLPYPR